MYLVIESLIILSLEFRQFKFWSQYLQNIKYMVKQSLINTKCLTFYLKQELGLDALFGEGAGPETAEERLFLVQTDPQVLHTEGQLLQGAVFHILQSNRKWVRIRIKIQYMVIHFIKKDLMIGIHYFKRILPIFLFMYSTPLLMRIQ